jgi:YegS/Rv2252/BmrU family lipid kinase
MKKKILLIVNPISGTKSKVDAPSLINTYINKDLFDFDIRFTEYPGHATQMAREAVDEHYDIVAAVGGDGTVNEVARSLVNTPTALAVIPCGSGNGLARHLFIPMRPKEAIDILNDCVIRKLDYGTINDYPFFCTCGMGFDAYISQKFAEAGKRGPTTYVEYVLREGLKYKPETYEIQDDQGVTFQKAFLISVANASQYGNNAYIAPQASMSDGLMDVVIMEPFDILDAPQISIDLLNKTLDKCSKIKTFRSKHIHIHRSNPGVVHYDGDPVMMGRDIDINIHPSGINIVVNAHADRSLRQPNLLQSGTAQMLNEISVIREDLTKRQRKVMALGKLLQRKLIK